MVSTLEDNFALAHLDYTTKIQTNYTTSIQPDTIRLRASLTPYDFDPACNHTINIQTDAESLTNRSRSLNREAVVEGSQAQARSAAAPGSLAYALSPERAAEDVTLTPLFNLNLTGGLLMPSTHLSLHYHLVFSTKNRIPIIGREWRANLHAYMGGIVRGIDGHPLAVGGVEDHAHLLIGLKATHRVDYVLRDVKADSSGWVHRDVGQRKFEWQPGYLGMTVSPSQIARVRKYILNQENHHRRKTFQDEYLELLKLSGIEYDEQYLW